MINKMKISAKNLCFGLYVTLIGCQGEMHYAERNNQSNRTLSLGGTEQEQIEGHYITTKNSGETWLKKEAVPAADLADQEILGEKRCLVKPGTTILVQAPPKLSDDRTHFVINTRSFIDAAPGHSNNQKCKFSLGYIFADHIEKHSGDTSALTGGDFDGAGGDSNLEVAYLSTIAFAEGTKDKGEDGYNVNFGRNVFFDSYDRHPNNCVPFYNPKTGKDDCSTAAGRYQILNWVWWGIPSKKKDGCVRYTQRDHDFGPNDQQMCAFKLSKWNGVSKSTINSIQTRADFSRIVTKLNNIWASFPGSSHQQRQERFDTMWQKFQDYCVGCKLYN